MKRAAAMLVVAAALAAPGAARAGGVAIEVWTGTRPDDAGDLLAPFFEEIGKRGATVGGPLRQQVDARLSAPAAQVTAEHLATADKLLPRAVEAVKAGRAAEALRMLPAAIDVYRAQSAAVAADPALRARAFQAQVALAVAQREVGNGADAEAAMLEAVRSFPDLDVAAAGMGPAAAELYGKAQAALKAQGTGALAITVSDAGATIYVNERAVGTGSAKVDLPPGRYRVHAQLGGVAGRMHDVSLSAGRGGTVTIDWTLDGALRTGEHGVALAFADDAARVKGEAALALALARALGAGEVVIAAVRDHNGKRAIVASVYSAKDGALLLAGAAPVEPLATAAQRARALARYLAGEPPDPAIEPLTKVEGGKQTKLAIPKKRGRSWRKVWAGGAVLIGVAGIATGITLMVMDGGGTCSLMPGQTQCPQLYDTMKLGVGTAVAGAAVAGLGAWLWLKKPSSEGRSLSVAPVSRGAAIVYGGRF